MLGDHVQICSVLYNTCQFELDEKKIGNASKSFGEEFSQKRKFITPRDGERGQKSEIAEITSVKRTCSDMLLPDKKSKLLATCFIQLSLSEVLS